MPEKSGLETESNLAPHMAAMLQFLSAQRDKRF